ncbi:4-alpha-glucanotransferase [Roseobacter sp. EG26]|uniref:4-alpha-glucanotransferase n=1 Tax=Roseobacter sp. EG26 TaxID=3412477 RepID=UPI003CE52027
MGADCVLSELAALAGIFPQFKSLEGAICPISPDTQRALLRANGLLAETPAQAADTLAALKAEAEEAFIADDVVVPCGKPVKVRIAHDASWQLIREDTGDVEAHGGATKVIELPGLPIGVHDLQLRSSGRAQQVAVIATPDRAPSVIDRAGAEKTWGVVAALYGLSSDRNNGLGDFEDLACLAAGLGKKGADFLGINPVHALGWSADETISPYSPCHRGFLNTAHIALDHIPNLRPASDKIGFTGELIDYAAHREAHQKALRAAFSDFQMPMSAPSQQAFDAFSQSGGDGLMEFAVFEALSEKFGSDWRKWPVHLHSRKIAEAEADPQAVRFHMWLQWLAASQLDAAQVRAKNSGMALGLYLDLAVGARRDGAEAWAAPNTLAEGVSLGAPPDQLSPAGQNWQLAAYAPRKLRQNRYAPLRDVLAQAMRHCGVLRIDHALGLNRSYWIPDDGSPGGYIRQPFKALSAIIAIEAERAGTVVIGEDLGLVPDGFRDAMAAKGLYGYTVLQYEKSAKGRFRKPKDLRAQSLACFGTHDTPTLSGFWQGQDIAWWHKLGWIDDTEKSKATDRRQQEKSDLLGLPPAKASVCNVSDFRTCVHENLAQSPAALVAVQLDDLLDVPDAQNLPGTIDEHPNWRRKTTVSVEDIANHPNLTQTAELMTKAGRGTLCGESRKEFE